MGIVFLSVGVSMLFAFRTCMDVSKVVGERIGSALEMGEGQVLGIRQGHPLEDRETGTIRNDYAHAHMLLIHILYANIDGEPPLLPHHHHEQPKWTREEKQRVVGRISVWTCTTLYLTSCLPQIWKNVSAFSRHLLIGPNYS